jgi:hypothetical protein
MHHTDERFRAANGTEPGWLTVSVSALVFLAACASGPFSVRRYGVVKDPEAFAREACGPYAKATSLQSSLLDVVPVREAISLRTGSVRECYLSALSGNLDLQGCVAVGFTVDDQQRVRSVRSLWNSTGVTRIAECVVGALGGIGLIRGARSSEYVQAFVFAQPQ